MYRRACQRLQENGRCNIGNRECSYDLPFGMMYIGALLEQCSMYVKPLFYIERRKVTPKRRSLKGTWTLAIQEPPPEHHELLVEQIKEMLIAEIANGVHKNAIS